MTEPPLCLRKAGLKFQKNITSWQELAWLRATQSVSYVLVAVKLKYHRLKPVVPNE